MYQIPHQSLAVAEMVSAGEVSECRAMNVRVKQETPNLRAGDDQSPPPTLDRAQMRERLKAIFDRREAGDIEGMLEFVAPDIVCFPASTWRHARYPRPILGREAVGEAFRQRHINYVNMATTIHRILVSGDEAVVHRTTEIRERGSGISYAFDCVDLFRFRDGLVVEFQEFPDGSAYDAVINFPH
jgi:ketosteroid isomerase-like protein